MASVQSVLEDWVAGESDKLDIYPSRQNIALRWINEAQLRFCDRSEMLRSVWNPTIDSTGIIALPSDFLREIKDMVKWTANVPLWEVDYPHAQLMNFSSPRFYSIWGNKFYVWAAASGTPSIPYIRKPKLIQNISVDDFEIPTEFQNSLTYYLESKWLKKNKDVNGSIAVLNVFDRMADEAAARYRARRDPVPIMRGSFF